jgi:hypothetical protein
MKIHNKTKDNKKNESAAEVKCKTQKGRTDPERRAGTNTEGNPDAEG